MPKLSNSKKIENICNDYISGMRLIELEKKYEKPSSDIIDILRRRNLFIPLRKRWTKDEVSYLKLNYEDTNWDKLLSVLHRWTKDEITHKAYKLKLSRDIFFWSKKEITLLKQYYKRGMSIEEIVILFEEKFSASAIYTKAYKLGLKTRERWNKDELDLLIKYYSIVPMEEMLKKLPNRSKDNIIAKARKLNIKSYFYIQRTWTESMDTYLKNNWDLFTDKELGIQLNKKAIAIKTRRHVLRLFREVSPAQYDYLYEFIRHNNKQWKKDSAKHCNYKCVVTGERFNHIHHLYGMNLIIEKTLESLNLKNIPYKDYSKEDLDKILNQFLIIQSKYPLGVCLSKTIHKDFHNKYGYGNNTPNQFEEFLQYYKLDKIA